MAGPTLYSCYASTLEETINPEPEETGTTENLGEVLLEVIKDLISCYGFADDHSIRKDFKAALDNLEEDGTVKQLEESLVRIKKWIDLNWLKMNESKTELIPFGSRHQLKKCKTKQININGEIVKRSNIIKYLSVFLDELLNLRQHITNRCKTAMYNWQCIRMIRPILTERATSALILGLLISHMDYANRIMIGLPETDLKKTTVSTDHVCKTSEEEGKTG